MFEKHFRAAAEQQGARTQEDKAKDDLIASHNEVIEAANAVIAGKDKRIAALERLVAAQATVDKLKVQNLDHLAVQLLVVAKLLDLYVNPSTRGTVASLPEGDRSVRAAANEAIAASVAMANQVRQQLAAEAALNAELEEPAEAAQ